MARAMKQTIWIVLACIAAPGLVVSPAGAAERVAMAGFPLAYPGSARKVAPRAKTDVPAPSVRYRNGAPAHDGYEAPPRPSATYRPPRLGKRLRVDLSRFRVTRPAADERLVNPTEWTVPRIIDIGVKRGVMPGAKGVGVAMPVAPYLALESRVGPDGEGDMALRFRLRY